MNLILMGLLLLFLAITAGALIRVRDLFTSVVLLGVFSGMMAVLYALLGGVDVAFTEAVVGASVSTILFIALLSRVGPSPLSRRKGGLNLVAVLISIGFVSIFLIGVEALPLFGDPTAASMVHVAPDYIRRSVQETATPNVVTAVLGDYRSFDTLIETAVIFTAALACLLVLGKERNATF